MVRYDENGHPSHPDEDLPPDGALIEMWRRADGPAWFVGTGIAADDTTADGHRSSAIRSTKTHGMAYPPSDMPLDVTPSGVVWRLL